MKCPECGGDKDEDQSLCPKCWTAANDDVSRALFKVFMGSHEEKGEADG